MSKNRLEAFSDGVIAIIITLLVLNIKVPDTPSLSGLYEIKSQLIAYILSFFFIAVIWQNHHQLLDMTKVINGKIVWANIFWLFSLTLAPFVTAWVGKYPFEKIPAIIYTIVFYMWSMSYGILTKIILKTNYQDIELKEILTKDNRSKISLIINIIVFVLIFIYPPVILIGRFIIALIWLKPYKKLFNN